MCKTMFLCDRKLEDYQAIGFKYYCSYMGVLLMDWLLSLEKYERIYTFLGKMVIVSEDWGLMV